MWVNWTENSFLELMAALNTAQAEEVDNHFDFEDMLVEDADCLAWDKELDLDGFEFIV